MCHLDLTKTCIQIFILPRIRVIGVLDASIGFGAGVVLRHRPLNHSSLPRPVYTPASSSYPSTSPSDIGVVESESGYYAMSGQIQVIVCTAPKYLTRHSVRRERLEDGDNKR